MIYKIKGNKRREKKRKIIKISIKVGYFRYFIGEDVIQTNWSEKVSGSLMDVHTLFIFLRGETKNLESYGPYLF